MRARRSDPQNAIRPEPRRRGWICAEHDGVLSDTLAAPAVGLSHDESREAATCSCFDRDAASNSIFFSSGS